VFGDFHDRLPYVKRTIMAIKTVISNKVQVIEDLTVTTGGNITIEGGDYTPGLTVPADNFTTYRVIGTSALSSNLAFVFGGAAAPEMNMYVTLLWEANVTTSGNIITIFGATVPDELISANFIAECRYNGSTWAVNMLPDFAGTGIIGSHRLASDSVTTAKIADNSVTLAKMAGLAKGNIIYGDASGDPAIVNLGAVDANLVVGDTTNGVAVVAMSGDATIAKTGALTIATSAVTTAKIANDAVTSAKLDDDSNRTQVVIPTSFESAGEIGVLEYKICFPCTLEAIHGTVTKPFTSTGTHIFKDDTGTVITGSQIDMSSGLFLGNIVSTTTTANNTFVAGDVIKIETSVSGAVGGRSTIVLCMLKS
jgi:hypothetical protein